MAKAKKTPHVDRPEGWEEEADKKMVERTATYPADLLERAKGLGINPDNFETQEELETAVETVEALRADEETE